MAESAGVPGGWEAYSSMNQQDRNSWRSTAVSLGRELSSTPTHLTRVLYIPRHDRQTSELSLYDITQEYGRAVGDVPMGSSMYTVKLEMAKVPKTEKEGGNPEYQIGFTEDNQNGEVVVGSVRNMSTLAEVEM